jgi:hypothetical protein
VTQGLLDPWYLGHCSGAMAGTFLLLVGTRFCVFYPQWRQIQLLLLVCATQNVSLNNSLVTVTWFMWIFINLKCLNEYLVCKILDFRHGAVKVFDLLEFSAASVGCYRRFGAACRSNLQRVKMS